MTIQFHLCAIPTTFPIACLEVECHGSPWVRNTGKTLKDHWCNSNVSHLKAMQMLNDFFTDKTSATWEDKDFLMLGSIANKALEAGVGDIKALPRSTLKSIKEKAEQVIKDKLAETENKASEIASQKVSAGSKQDEELDKTCNELNDMHVWALDGPVSRGALVGKAFEAKKAEQEKRKREQAEKKNAEAQKEKEQTEKKNRTLEEKAAEAQKENKKLEEQNRRQARSQGQQIAELQAEANGLRQDAQELADQVTMLQNLRATLNEEIRKRDNDKEKLMEAYTKLRRTGGQTKLHDFTFYQCFILFFAVGFPTFLMRVLKIYVRIIQHILKQTYLSSSFITCVMDLSVSVAFLWGCKFFRALDFTRAKLKAKCQNICESNVGIFVGQGLRQSLWQNSMLGFIYEARCQEM